MLRKGFSMTTAIKSKTNPATKPGKGKKRTGTPRAVQSDRKALVKSLRGSLSWVDYSVDRYLEEKYAETERENRS